MSQHYDNAAKFVTAGYPKPFAEHILEYPNLVVLEELATEQVTLKAHYTDSTLKVQFPDEIAILHNEVQTYDSREPMPFRFAGYNGFLIRVSCSRVKYTQIYTNLYKLGIFYML